jgi:hypothetical protein
MSHSGSKNYSSVVGATAEGNKEEWIKAMVNGKVERVSSYQGGL